MSEKRLTSFSSGEIDPILHDRVTLEKFNKGLATARNVMISKTGSILSRFSRAQFAVAKNADENIVLYSPRNSGKIIEFGLDYLRIYDFDGTLDAELTTLDGYFSLSTLTYDDLKNFHFETTGNWIYIFLNGEYTHLFNYDITDANYTGSIATSVLFYDIPPPSASYTITPVGGPTGYIVDYGWSVVVNGEEGILAEYTSGLQGLPIATGQSNNIQIELAAIPIIPENVTEVKFYRRPALGSGYGYIGSTTKFSVSGGKAWADFQDYGGGADFTNQPIKSISEVIGRGGISDSKSKTGIIYQQRLLITDTENKEAIYASRPRYRHNFYRDFPYDADSALLFKAGSSGSANVLRMIENDGLVVFTTNGVYVSAGVLTVDNLALERKGSWIISETVPPLAVPGGVFFVEKSTNAVKQFVYSRDILTYQSLEVTIFSNHLFETNTITSWAFQEGIVPMIIVTFSDGTWATFTYHYEHEMRAWTRHDSKYPVEQVVGTGVADSTFFVTNKDGQRHIEVSLPRKLAADVIVDNPEADKSSSNSFMDAVKTQSTLMNDSLSGSDEFVLALTTSSWEDPLTLTCGTSALFTDPGLGEVGTIFRHFNLTDRTVVDLEVTARASDNSVTVEPSSEFPSAQASGFRLYETFTEVTGLSHLEGEEVSILLDGYVSASPNNTVEGYETATVSSGAVTLPNGERGAIVIVGRPITADIKTLNIHSLEQAPTMTESINVNQLHVRMHQSRGLYCSNEFPENRIGEVDGSSVEGMEDMDLFDLDDEADILGNRYKQPVSKRIEKSIPGSWNSRGQIAIRQVDPVHFEILSIIPDVEVLRRSDR